MPPKVESVYLTGGREGVKRARAYLKRHYPHVKVLVSPRLERRTRRRLG